MCTAKAEAMAEKCIFFLKGSDPGSLAASGNMYQCLPGLGRDYSWHTDMAETAKKQSCILMITRQTSSQICSKE